MLHHISILRNISNCSHLKISQIKRLPNCFHHANSTSNCLSRLTSNTFLISRHLSTEIEPPSPKTNNNNTKTDSRKNEFKFTWKSFLVGAICCAATGLYFEYTKREKLEEIKVGVKSYGKPALGGPFVMFNQDGVPVTDATYHGNFVLLYFGFTFCPDICPNELVKMGKVIDAIDAKKNPQSLVPIFISLDPARDTLGQLKNYGQDFHPKFHWLTGTKDQIANVTRSFRVYFSKVDENDDNDEDYLVDHSIVMYLLSPSGEFLEFYTQRATVSDIVGSVEKHIKLYKSNSSNIA